MRFWGHIFSETFVNFLLIQLSNIVYFCNEWKQDKYYMSNCNDLDNNLPRRKLTPIILSDSKARYLFPKSASRLEHGFVCLIWFFTSHQQSFSYKLEHGIVWLYEPGLSAEKGIKWAASLLEIIESQFGKFELFILLGTCDLELKNKQGLILRPRVSSVACRLIRNLENSQMMQMTESTQWLCWKYQDFA